MICSYLYTIATYEKLRMILLNFSSYVGHVKITLYATSELPSTSSGTDDVTVNVNVALIAKIELKVYTKT